MYYKAIGEQLLNLMSKDALLSELKRIFGEYICIIVSENILALFINNENKYLKSRFIIKYCLTNSFI